MTKKESAELFHELSNLLFEAAKFLVIATFLMGGVRLFGKFLAWAWGF